MNLRNITRRSTHKPPKVSKSENVEGMNNTDHPAVEPTSEEGRKILVDPSSLLSRVSFRRENFVLSRLPEDKRYDTIIW